jgi:magnesium-transporting ATPase (P-type)
MEMLAFFVALWANGWRPGHAFPDGHALLVASGAAFSAVVLGQLANAFACRSAKNVPWRVAAGSNRGLFFAVAAEIVLLLGFLGVGPIARLLGQTWPGIAGATVALLTAPAVLAVDAIEKRLHRRSVA